MLEQGPWLYWEKCWFYSHGAVVFIHCHSADHGIVFVPPTSASMWGQAAGHRLGSCWRGPGSGLKARPCAATLWPWCSGNARRDPAPPLPHLCRVRKRSCQSLCSTGQWGVSAASPIVPGESLATADVVTAPVATQPNNQDHRSCTHLSEWRIRFRNQAKTKKWTLRNDYGPPFSKILMKQSMSSSLFSSKKSGTKENNL